MPPKKRARTLRLTPTNTPEASGTQPTHSQLSTRSASKRKRPAADDTDHSYAEEDSNAANGSAFVDDGYASRSGECSPPCKHHPMSTKYPHLDMPHAANLVKFAADVDECVQAMFPRQPGYYQSAHILFLSWEEDHELDAKSQIDELEVLMQQFQFTADMNLTTSWFPIPSKKSHQMLEGKLVSARNDHALESSQLLIIYYGGHGRIDEKSGRSIWYAWREPPPGTFRITPEVDWTSLQFSVINCSGNLLIILDCCCASATVDYEHSGVKELLAAGGVSDSTSAFDANSFTRAIITEMKAILARKEPSLCHVTALFQRLYSHQTRHNLRVTPIYVPLSNSERPGSIALLYPGPDPIPSGIELPKLFELNEDSLKSQSRILISVRLTDPRKPGYLQDWAEWFTTAPPGFEHVKVEAKFHSRSTLLLVSLPMAMWNILPDDPAYSFIDIVESRNVLLAPKEVDATSAHISEAAVGKAEVTNIDAITQIATVEQPEPTIPSLMQHHEGDGTLQETAVSPLDASQLAKAAGLPKPSRTGQQNWDRIEDPGGRLFRLVRLIIRKNQTLERFRFRKREKRVEQMVKHLKIQREKRIWWKVFRQIVRNLREKLDSENVKLVTIHSGTENSPLSVTIASWTFGNLGVDANYDALSYCWGVEDAPTPIEVFFTSKPSIKVSSSFEPSITVRQNLYDALIYFRHPQSDVTIWVDALCIDARNPEARKALTPRIPEIFSKADRVHFWMEDRDSGTGYLQQQTSSWREPALPQPELPIYPTGDLVDPLLSFHPLESDFHFWMEDRDSGTGYLQQQTSSWREPAPLQSEPPIYPTEGLVDPLLSDTVVEPPYQRGHDDVADTIRMALDSLDWQPLSDTAARASIAQLARSTLFKRRWIIQELFFAKQAILHWKTRNIRWQDFEDAISQFLQLDFEHEVSSEDYVNLKRLQTLIDVVSNGACRSIDGAVEESLLRLDALVVKCADFENSVYYPLDVINALVGIANTGKSALHSRWRNFEGYPPLNPTPSSVLMRYESFFTRAVFDSKSLDIMFRPWATIYTSGSEAMPSYIATIDQLPFRADQGRVRGDSFVGEQHSTYNASGGRIPRINRNNGRLSVLGIAKDLVTWTSGCIPGAIIFGEAVQRACDGKNPKPVPDKLWRTLVANRGPNGQIAPGFYRRVCEECFGNRNYLNVELLLSQSPGSMKKEFLRRVKAVVWNRAFFQTMTGKFGIGPAGLKAGDTICILFGCSVPVVLREQGKGKDLALTHTVIGEAFVYGMMDGERVLDRGQVERDFELV